MNRKKGLKGALLLLFMVLTIGMVSPVTAEAANENAVKSVSLKVGKTKVTKKTYKLKQKKSAVIKVQVSPSSAKESVSFKSSNKKIATVSKSGKVIGKKDGTAKITVKVRGKDGKVKSAWMKVKVYSPKYVKVSSNYKLNYKSLYLQKGTSQTLKAYSAKGKLTWSSTNSKIAVVSSKGKVTAKKPGTVYIKVRDSKTNKSLKCKVKVTSRMTESQAKRRLMALKSKYPVGKPWGDNKYYFWEATRTNGSGCYAYVAIISDKVFGKSAGVKTHRSFSKIKVGDHVRLGTKGGTIGYHSVIVISKSKSSITVTEGNFNSSVMWGRKISKSQLSKEGFYVDTRY